MMIKSIISIDLAGFIYIFLCAILAMIVEPPALEFPFIIKPTPNPIVIPPKIESKNIL